MFFGGVELGGSAEEAVLSAFAVARNTQAGFESAVESFGELGAIAAQRIERAGFDETFEHAAIHGGQIDALAEIVDGSEAAALFARGDNGFDSSLADILYRA